MATQNVLAPPYRYLFLNLSAAGSTQVKTNVGSLGNVTVNTGAADSTLALYDGTSDTGTPIATIDAADQVSLLYGCQFNVGLYAVMTGSANITIVYT